MRPTIAYQDNLSESQRDALREFGQLVSERDYPLHFVGRTDVLDFLKYCVTKFSRGSASGPQTRIITGAPGVGKTSLLTRLARDTRDSNIAHIMVDGSDFNSPFAFVSAFIDGLSVSPNDMSTTTKTANEGGFSYIVGGKKTWEKNSASAIQRLNDGESVWRVCRSLLKKKQRKATMVLMVDEAQAIDTSVGVNNIVRDLQRGATGHFRILPIFAGLLNTDDVLEKVGISRAAFSAQRLEALSADECAEAVNHFLAREDMGLDTLLAEDDRQAVAELFTVASEGWPRHLHCYMTALAAQIATDFNQPAPPPKLNLDAVLDAGHRERIAYSHRRTRRAELPPFALDALETLADEMDEGKSLTLKDIHASCNLHAGQPVDITDLQQNLLGQAVHAGILQPEDAGKAYTFPIPSLRSYMACGLDSERTLAAMRGDLETRLQST